MAPIKILINGWDQEKSQQCPKRNDFCTIFVSKCVVGKHDPQLSHKKKSHKCHFQQVSMGIHNVVGVNSKGVDLGEKSPRVCKVLAKSLKFSTLKGFCTPPSNIYMPWKMEWVWNDGVCKMCTSIWCESTLMDLKNGIFANSRILAQFTTFRFLKPRPFITPAMVLPTLPTL